MWKFNSILLSVFYTPIKPIKQFLGGFVTPAINNYPTHITLNICIHILEQNYISVFQYLLKVGTGWHITFFTELRRCVYLLNFVRSVENCNRVLNANGAQWLCSRLMDYDPSRQLLFRSVEILWNVLEKSANREQLGVQLNDILCIRYADISHST